MKFTKSLFIAVALLSSMTAQANEQAKQSAKEVSDQITVFAAGFCKGMQDKHGMDFNVCFKQATDVAISKLQSLAVQSK